MLKDDTRDQIPLFELTVPDKSTGSAPAATDKSRETAHEKPAPRKKSSPEKVSYKPLARETKRHGAARPTAIKSRTARTAPAPVPEGDVRLTANIREDLHLKLKIVAATRRTTIGELIEELVERYL
jgi:hypothetical protein